MRMVDCKCPECGDVYVDVLLRARDDEGNYIYPACRCGATVARVYLQGHSHGVVSDDIKGGVFYAKNGICNPDGSPKRYTKVSEMKRDAKAMGLVQHVEHQGGKGSDKSRHTQRFI
jgi:hypothetical protein